jgi:tRNA and rRNA cytosine-C5-methylases
MNLDTAFLKRMQELLSEEYDDFIACYTQPPCKGVRLNSIKCSEEILKKSLPFSITPSGYSTLSYFADTTQLGSLSAYHAGMFYAQEPSASSVVTVLAPKPGEKVLDLCAAPGGKSTQVAALLQGKGLLWSNEFVKKRANILMSNMERMGVRNAVITALHPEKLCSTYAGYFDKVLVDAPCSGEGMFRKEKDAVADWSEEAVLACARRQQEILASAAKAVKAGGVLVYSTCTFSVEENEGTIKTFLENHPEFEIEPINVPFGRPAINMSAVRIYPMDGGEGHFAARLRKTEDTKKSRVGVFKGKTENKLSNAFLENVCKSGLEEKVYQFGSKLYIIPQDFPDVTLVPVLRAGVELGEIKGSRIEPSHAFFMSRKPKELRQSLNFSDKDENLLSFLRGEEIDCDKKGYTAVTVNGVVTGFGKASNGRLKNHYPKGLRLLK